MRTRPVPLRTLMYGVRVCAVYGPNYEFQDFWEDCRQDWPNRKIGALRGGDAASCRVLDGNPLRHEGTTPCHPFSLPVLVSPSVGSCRPIPYLL
jgi:hypothetical protein